MGLMTISRRSPPADLLAGTGFNNESLIWESTWFSNKECLNAFFIPILQCHVTITALRQMYILLQIVDFLDVA